MYLQNDTASAIRRIQEYLSEIHLYENTSYAVAPDGIYGEETKKAVKQFQIRENLSSTGIVDLLTFEMLRDTAKKYRIENSRDKYLYSKDGFPISLGSHGTDVDVLHALLRAISEYEPDLPPIPRASYFSAETKAAVQYMQRIFLTEPDGMVNAEFFNMLENELEARRGFHV